MSIGYYLGKALTLPPRTVLRRGGQIIRREAARIARRARDRALCTYAPPCWPPGTALERYFPDVSPAALGQRREEIAALAALALDHRFDLLGSGWTKVEHHLVCRGVEGFRYQAPQTAGDPGRLINRANRRASKRLRALITRDYRPIDWQLDFKSGFRWQECRPAQRIRYGHLPGVDVKVPWELSRMQHLPQLALAAALARDGAPGFAAPEVYAREFRDQVLDFAAANPPRFGVAWACTMDVAIRAANWAVAQDLFRGAGQAFDRPFTDALVRSLDDHARFIAGNLEWGVELRANHYLADVTGLLFACVYLPRSPRTDAWLAFAVQELVAETALQVNPDGSSFEGSTSYHRLVGEMVLYGTALVLGLPARRRAALAAYDCGLAPRPPGLRARPLAQYPLPGTGGPTPFPPEHFRRLERMAEFTLHLSDPGGQVPQLGDNDSGRFLKLFPAVRRTTAGALRARYENLAGWSELPDAAGCWDEDAGDHRHLLAAINGLFGRPDLAAASAGHLPETEIVRGLAGGVALPSGNGEGPPAAEQVRLEEGEAAAPAAGAGGEQVREFRFPGGDLRAGLRLAGYPDFGLWIFRSRRLRLAVRCGPVGQRGNGGHAHNDQLSLVLAVDGREIVADPGTYLYTPLPARRDEYRSVRAHFAPRVDDEREPGRLDLGLFRLGEGAEARCLMFSEAGFLGTHRGFGAPVWRRVEILADRVVVTDRAGAGLRLLAAEARGAPPPHSPGYGKRERR